MATNLAAQAPQPSPDLLAFNRLLGTWLVSDPSGQNATHGTVRFEWLPGSFFLLQHLDLVHRGRPIQGLEVIGHRQPFGEAPSPEIRSCCYDNEGNTLGYVYELEGDTLTIWGGEKNSPAYYRGTFSADGDGNTGRWTYPGGGYASAMTRLR